MSIAIATAEIERRPLADTALTAATVVWFFVMLIGQWLFLYFIAAFYGPSTLSGNLEAWNRKELVRGFVPGDTAGNLAFATHVFLAAVIVFGGTLQLIPQIRARAIWFHRWVGRAFLVASMAAALGGLAMVWVRGARIGMIDSIAISLDATLILCFAVVAWRAARARDVALHRRWALRTFMVANGVFFLRLAYFGWPLLTDVSIGPVFFLFEFASYLVPLTLLELYLHTKNRGSSAARFSMAGALLVSAAYMSVGTLGNYLTFAKWLSL